MGAVLNQDEVDALLRGVSGDDMDMDDEEDEYDPEEVVPFDLTAQDRIIRGRMPTLEIIHDRFVRLFRLGHLRVLSQGYLQVELSLISSF